VSGRVLLYLGHLGDRHWEGHCLDPVAAAAAGEAVGRSGQRLLNLLVAAVRFPPAALQLLLPLLL
jgi:hypothetical protein